MRNERKLHMSFFCACLCFFFYYGLVLFLSIEKSGNWLRGLPDGFIGGRFQGIKIEVLISMQITEGQLIVAFKSNYVESGTFLTNDRAQASILRGNVCESTTSKIYLSCAHFVTCRKVLQSILMWGRSGII